MHLKEKKKCFINNKLKIIFQSIIYFIYLGTNNFFNLSEFNKCKNQNNKKMPIIKYFRKIRNSCLLFFPNY